MRVLTIEPFYGGSHRQFLDQWAEHSSHTFDLVTFPPHHWKWRMRHSAVSSARLVKERLQQGHRWDVVFASSMLPLAELQGLCASIAELPSVLYFHENQLTYPLSEHSARDEHLVYSEFVSACAADVLWFNSGFHRGDWLAALPAHLRRFPDFAETPRVAELENKASVQWPGVDSAPLEGARARNKSRPVAITWAARWEHDKNPEDLFRGLQILTQRRPDLAWRVNVLGQRFASEPECFEQGRLALGERVGCWGFLERQDYLNTLAETDVFVSTAKHEFFGLSAVEAMLAGARPLLPDRLSYPELVQGNAAFLYDGSTVGLAAALEELIEAGADDDAYSAELCASERFAWSHRAPALDSAVSALTSAGSTQNGDRSAP